MIRGQLVVDASVVVEYLVDLDLTREATGLFTSLGDPGADLDLWAPDLIYSEVASALRKLARLKAIPTTAAGRCVDRLARLPIAATGTASLLGAAWQRRDKMSIYDACYVSLAERLGCRVVTADKKLCRAAGPNLCVFLGDLAG